MKWFKQLFAAAPEGRSAIQQLLDFRMQVASGAIQVDASTLAAAEIAAGLWERAMAGGSSDRLSSQQLGIIGRQLLVRGESVWLSRGPLLVPAADWDLTSTSIDPGQWMYRLTLAGPSGSATINASANDVLHARIRVDQRYPWIGRSPWTIAKATARLAAALEASLSFEEGGPIGHVLPVPNLAGASEVADAMPMLNGKVVLGETMSAGWEQGEGRRPGGREWQPVRIGPTPPESQLELREGLERSLLAAAGVPIELAYPGAGSDAREGWRRFLFATIQPVGKIVGAEAQRVLGGNGRIDWTDLAASDLQVRARAYGRLRETGMGEAEARRICGLE